MGLCKCPKRQVTTQFCFEHRVNVCENCMVQSHPKCIVQAYLQWLKDSDYEPNCSLCSTALEQGDCVRLGCYHVFHWDCLNARQSKLPANTAPRGHQCPQCNAEIFPAPNLVSPVAELLKLALAKVNWGRNGLGLDLLNEENNISNAAVNASIAPKMATLPAAIVAPAASSMIHHHSKLGSSNAANSYGNEVNSSTIPKNHSNSPHSVLLMDAFNPPADSSSSRRPLLPRAPPIGAADRDDNKYRRRTPSEIFSRWSRRLYAPSSRPPWRRTWFLVTSGILAFVIIIYIMAALGRGGSNQDDESWHDPNPNPMPESRHYE